MSKEYIDLTLPIHDGMATYPVHWHPPVEISTMGRHGIEDRETRKLVLGTHTGTHLDAPAHFIKNGATVDLIPLDILMGQARVLDFSNKPNGYELQISDFTDKLGSCVPERLVLRFDWCQYFGTMKYYTDIPFISEEAAKWLVDQGIKLIAMDTPMPDNPKNGRNSGNDSPNHVTFLGSGVVIVEYLTNLAKLPEDFVDISILPLNLKGCDGSPVRAVAAIEKA